MRQEERKFRRVKSEKSDADNPLARAFGQGGNNATGDQADWGSVEAAHVVGLIQVVTSRGGAVRFGYTRDGGAYSVGIYLGANSVTLYCRPSEDLVQFLEETGDKVRNLDIG